MKKNTLRFMLLAVVFVSAMVVYSQTIPFSDFTSSNDSTRSSAIAELYGIHEGVYKPQAIQDKEKLMKQLRTVLETDTTLSRENKHHLMNVLEILGHADKVPYLFDTTTLFSRLTSQNEYVRGDMIKAFSDVKTIPDKENLCKQILSISENDTTLSNDIKDDLIEVLSISSCTAAYSYIVHYFAVNYADFEYMIVVSLSDHRRMTSAKRAVEAMGSFAVPYMLDELRKDDSVSGQFIYVLKKLDSKYKEHINQLIREEKDKNNPKKLLQLEQYLN